MSLGFKRLRNFCTPKQATISLTPNNALHCYVCYWYVLLSV